ncbi:MAG: hypothetical protein EBW39_05815 [Betaproteobacteria bacterium]|nr:hypothetical protein [Betaproteobacteria bacterium]
MKNLRVGLLGMGTVGGGTFEVLSRNHEEIKRRAGCDINITRVADKDLDRVRARLGDRAALCDDAFSIVNDPDIDVVIELLGGYGVAKEPLPVPCPSPLQIRSHTSRRWIGIFASA